MTEAKQKKVRSHPAPSRDCRIGNILGEETLEELSLSLQLLHGPNHSTVRQNSKFKLNRSIPQRNIGRKGTLHRGQAWQRDHKYK